MEFGSAVPLINGVESFVERSPPEIAGAVGAAVSIVIADASVNNEIFPLASVNVAVIFPEVSALPGVHE